MVNKDIVKSNRIESSDENENITTTMHEKDAKTPHNKYDTPKRSENKIDKTNQIKSRKISPKKKRDRQAYEMFCETVIQRGILVKNIYKPTIKKLAGNYVCINSLDGYVVKKVEHLEKGKKYIVSYNGIHASTDLSFCVRNGTNRMSRMPFNSISRSIPSYAEYIRFKNEHENMQLQQEHKKAKEFIELLKQEVEPKKKCSLLKYLQYGIKYHMSVFCICTDMFWFLMRCLIRQTALLKL